MAVPIHDSMAPEPPGVTEEEKAALVGQILRGELTPGEACQSAGLSEPELKQWVRAYARAARRAVDHQVAEALAAHGLPVDESGPPEFLGNLDSMSVADLIQTVQFGKKDAQIRIDHLGEQSQLWCMEGEVVDAATGRLSGAAAVYRILALTHGRVHADFAPVQRPRAIHASTQALLLEAAKRSDECALIRERLGDTLNIYVVSPSAPPLAEIEPDQAQVLAAFDGARSVEEVVRESEFPDLETLTMIARLVEQQWLVLRPFALQTREVRSSLVPAPPLEGSFMPLAASLPTALAARPRLEEPRIQLWASAVAGVAVVGIAFVVGFYSARSGDPTRRAAAAAPTAPTVPTCPASATSLGGGLCLDLAAVTAGEYQACVRAGACEPVQREFEQGLAAQGQGVADRGLADQGLASAASSPVNGGPRGASADEGAAPNGAGTNTAPSGAGTAPVTAVASMTPPTPAPAAPAAGASEPSRRGERTARCNAGLSGRESYPVNCLTVQQARRYCEWRGGRLPTRSEWELAATPGRVPALADLSAGLSEWTLEPAPAGVTGGREHSVVLGGEAGAFASISRLASSANAQGKGVGFRCAVQIDEAPPSGTEQARSSNP